MARNRRRRVDAGLLVIWIVFWTAGIMVAIWKLGSAALSGELAAAVILAIWIGAAGFGLTSAIRRLVQLTVTGRPRRPDTRRWEDGMDPPEGRVDR